jgi:hypothetical protein
MKCITFLAALALTLVFSSCKKEEDDFSISFETTEYNTTFLTAGATEAVVINSDIGNPEFQIQPNPVFDEVTFDDIDNKLKWRNDLPLGTHEITLVAEKGSRITTATVTIINEFVKGHFVGNLDESDDGALTAPLTQFTCSFATGTSAQGAPVYQARAALTGVDSVGGEFFEIGGDHTVTFTITHSAVPFLDARTYQGQLVITGEGGGVGAYIVGKWYNGVTVSDTPQGDFRIDYNSLGTGTIDYPLYEN